jgi:hypothetical protein
MPPLMPAEEPMTLSMLIKKYILSLMIRVRKQSILEYLANSTHKAFSITTLLLEKHGLEKELLE